MNRYDFIEEDLVQHRYGGVYTFVGHATNTVDGSPVVVYKHVWPFNTKLFSRPESEFYDKRFRKITPLEFIEIKKKWTTSEMQALIQSNKDNSVTIWDQNAQR